MPQVGWLIDGKKYSCDKVMAHAKTYPVGWRYTPEFLDGMRQHTERDYYSPTTIAGCPRESFLRTVLPYYKDIDKAWAAFRGTTAHEVLRKARQLEPEAIIEKTIACRVDQIDGSVRVLQGTPDKVVPHERLLVDYKTVVEHVYHERDPKKKIKGWRAQLSIYRWMLWQHGIEIDRAMIMQWHPEFPEPLELELWPLDRTERHIKFRMHEYRGVYEDVFSIDGKVLPKPLDSVTNKDTFWKCVIPGYCDVRDDCFKFVAEGF